MVISTTLYKENSSFLSGQQIQNILKKFFNHLHNLHFQGLLHCQNLNCSLYAQPLKQAKKNYQRFNTRQPKLAIWSLTIGSFSISYCNFLTSLILATQEILGEYKLMSFLPKAFPVFLSFSFSSRCLYSAYVLLIVSLLALSTYSCVPLRPNKYTLPFLMTHFKHSRFLCCSMPSFGVSTVYPKKSSSFNMFSTSAIIFITGWNRHHIDIRYKGNINNTSVIIFLMDNWDDFCKLSKNSQ